MKIRLNDITDLGSELDFTQETPWVVKAVECLDETETHPKRPVQVHLNLRKVDEIVVISGNIDTYLDLLCSRCGNAFHLNCNSHFSGLYSNDPEMAGVAHLLEPGKPGGQNRGFARHAHEEAEEYDEITTENSEILGKDLDITYLPDEQVDLGAVLTEQLQIQIPLQPLCHEDCKGVCATCGTDLNKKQCECSKRASRNNAFSVLENLKL